MQVPALSAGRDSVRQGTIVSLQSRSDYAAVRCADLQGVNVSVLIGTCVGGAAGLIVSSWQGFKDPPWEGFFIGRFFRSIFVGAGAGAALCFAASRGVLAIDNTGVLAFSVVAVERIVGEAYKGFLRRRAHGEYFKLLRRMHVPEGIYAVKLLTGVGFLVGAYWMFRLLSYWLRGLVAFFGGRTVPGLVIGIAGGLLVAIGGALKDSQFEGFIPAKFVRSPIVGALTGMVFVHFSSSWFLVSLAAVGGERVGVELSKTFLKRQVRGMHADQPVRYPAWFARRGVFALSYGLAVAACILLLIR